MSGSYEAREGVWEALQQTVPDTKYHQGMTTASIMGRQTPGRRGGGVLTARPGSHQLSGNSDPQLRPLHGVSGPTQVTPVWLRAGSAGGGLQTACGRRGCFCLATPATKPFPGRVPRNRVPAERFQGQDDGQMAGRFTLLIYTNAKDSGVFSGALSGFLCVSSPRAR